MKNKTLLIFCFLVFTTSLVFSQLSIGVKTNPIFFNGSYIQGNYGNNSMGTTEDDYVGLFAFPNFGVLLNYEVGRNFAVQTEFNFKQQGVSQNKDKFEQINLSYFEIPLLIQYKGNSNPSLFLNAGPSIKVKTKAQYSYKFEDGENGRKYCNANDAFNSLVLTGNIGGGASFRLTNSLSVTGEMRVGYDLTQTAKKTESVKLSSLDDWYFNRTNILQVAGLIGLVYKL